MKDEMVVKLNFNRWNNALQSGIPEDVVALYAKECFFLPTLSNVFIKDRVKVKEYFKHFCEKNPVGTITDEKVITLSDDAYEHIGLYIFTIGPENDRTTIRARFSFLWIRSENNDWLIKTHHSSVEPK